MKPPELPLHGDSRVRFFGPAGAQALKRAIGRFGRVRFLQSLKESIMKKIFSPYSA